VVFPALGFPTNAILASMDELLIRWVI